MMGSGPFIFDKREAGARITGKRNPNYYHKGLPYLDGFEAIFAKKQSLRVQAIRGDQAAIEFRSFPPRAAMIWSRHSARISLCRRATGTAA